MFIIGVYGPSGAGKSTLAKRLAKDLNATYVEVDKYWKNVYYSDFFQKFIVPFFRHEKNLQKPENTIENGYVRLKDLKVNARQARIMRKLLYIYLNYRINRKIRKSNADIIIFDHIKFFEFDAFNKSDYNIFVNTSDDICEENIMKRDYITKDRMKTLVDNHIVEHTKVFDNVKKDCTINAFCDDFELEYKQLCLSIIQKYQNKNIKRINSQSNARYDFAEEIASRNDL